MEEIKVKRNYEIAREIFSKYGVDTDKVIEKMDIIPVSIQCWQLDDVSGFERNKEGLSGGIAVTGSAKGKAESVHQYFEMMDKVLNSVPGKKKLALHAMYLLTDEDVDRNQIEPKHFEKWVNYAKEKGIGLDFNPTYFSHKLSENGTLTSSNRNIREFWIEHGKRCRKIGEYFGRELGITCYTNHWIPDGMKDICIDKVSYRKRLIESYNEIFKEPIDKKYNVDSVESKLFGIGTESYVVGSNEFYTNYVNTYKNCIICLDTGHFHPTEKVSDKISSYLAFDQEVMLHVSRPVRWDSDHVVIYDDETKMIMHEIAVHDAFDKVHIGLDFFDGSIDRTQAVIIGANAAKKAILTALLEPLDELINSESNGDFTRRLWLSEQVKLLPYGAIWDYYCLKNNVKNGEVYICA